MVNKIDDFSLDNLVDFTKHMTPEIGFFGGRKFVVRQAPFFGRQELSLTDLYLRLDWFSYLKDPGSANQIEKIIIQLDQKDKEANELLSKANFFQRVLTVIKSFLNGVNRNALKQQISDRIKPGLEQFSKEQQEKEDARKAEEARKKKIEDHKMDLQKKSLKELIETVSPLLIEDKPKAPKTEDEKTLTRLTTSAVLEKVKTTFNTQEIIESLENSDKRSRNLTYEAIIETIPLPLNKIIHALESDKYKWSSEEAKKRALEELSYFAIINMISDRGSTSCVIIDGKEIRTIRYVLDTRKVLGRGVHNESSLPMSPHLAEGIGEAFRSLGQIIADQLVEDKNSGTLSDKSYFGYEIVIGQFVECRFTASVIRPLLSHLVNLPGLLKLDMNDIGGSPLFTLNDKGAFEDQDAEVLRQILDSNQRAAVALNVASMTEEKKVQLTSTVKEIEQPFVRQILG